jgi:transcriptional regulator with XRE-family HTH domain
MYILARRMRSRRKTLGLTQEQLAEKADLSANYIAKLELGDRIPSFSTLVCIAEALDIEVFELLSVSKGKPGIGAAQEVERVMKSLSEEDAEFLLSELQNIAHYIKSLRRK